MSRDSCKYVPLDGAVGAVQDAVGDVFASHRVAAISRPSWPARRGGPVVEAGDAARAARLVLQAERRRPARVGGAHLADPHAPAVSGGRRRDHAQVHGAGPLTHLQIHCRGADTPTVSREAWPAATGHRNSGLRSYFDMDCFGSH